MARFRPEQTYSSIVVMPPSGQTQVFNTIHVGGPTPMEIYSTRRRGPLIEVEKQ